MIEKEIDVLNIVLRGYQETAKENKNVFTDSCRLEEEFVASLNAKQKQNYHNLKLLFKSDSVSEVKNAIKFTLRFISGINTFEKEKSKIRFD